MSRAYPRTSTPFTPGRASQQGVPPMRHAALRPSPRRSAPTIVGRRGAATEAGAEVPALATRHGLLMARPIEALLATWEAEIPALRRRLGEVDAVTCLESAAQELAAAVAAAQTLTAYQSPAAIAALVSKGESTVRRECQTHGGALGATRNGAKGWVIHVDTYLRWMAGQTGVGGETA